MESRRIITAILLAFLVWMLLQKFETSVRPPQPAATTTATAPSSQSATQPGHRQVASSGPAGVLNQDTGKIDNFTLGHSLEGNGYLLQATFSNLGASLETVELSEHSRNAHAKKQRYELVHPVKYPGNGIRPSLGTESVTIIDAKQNKITANLDNARWFHRVKDVPNGQAIEFYLDVVQNNKPLVQVVKTFTVTKANPEVKFDNPPLKFNLAFKNLTGEPLTVTARQEGLVGIQKEDTRYEDRKVYAGTAKSGRPTIAIDYVDRAALLKLADRARQLGGADEQVVWAGQTNKYFASLMSAINEQDKLSSKWIETVEAKAYSEDNELGEDLSTVWVTRSIPLAPRQAETVNFDIYLGPKSDEVFLSGKYANRNFNGIFIAEGSWCTMQWLADFMTWLLRLLYKVTHNYGLAIILLVIIVRVVLHPVSKSSQVNMARMQRNMQRLQPKINALKEKYKNNREALNKATMEMYKEEGINPASQMLGCLPMMLQMPIWVALWTALNNTFALRHQPFVLWIKDLAGPDALVHFSRAIDIPLISLMMGPIQELNILPLLVIGAMLLQQIFSPQTAPSPDADPAQMKQQKFMLYFMSLFMGFIFYNAPSGLNLYILTSTLLGVVESKRIRQHLEEEQKRPPEPKKRESSFWERIQKRMEQYATEHEKSKKAKKK